MKYLKSFNENKVEDVLEKISEFADNAHKSVGQKRKYTNEEYITHPITVCNTCKEYTSDICVLAAALLHDVLEDTEVTREQIEEFLSQYLDRNQVFKTLGYVDDLTDVYTKEAYPHLNRKQRKVLEIKRMSTISTEAQTVKYADIMDNAPSIAANDPSFIITFLEECKEKMQVLDKGNPILRQKVLDMLNNI